METLEYLKVIKTALEDKKAEDITIIDIRGISPLADYFVIASASNQNQLLAMRDAVQEDMHKNDAAAKHIEGNQSSTWILMDYQDIVIHLFDREDRLFYDLERIWRDCKVVEL